MVGNSLKDIVQFGKQHGKRVNMEIKRFGKLAWQWIIKTEDYVAIAALLISVGLVTLAVVSRVAFDYEEAAWEELARFASLWMYLIGVAVTSKEGSHLRMGFLETRLTSPRIRSMLEVVNDIIMLIIFAFFIWWALWDVMSSIERGESSLILKMGMWTVRSAFIVGSFLSIIHVTIFLVRHVKAFYDQVRGLP